MHRRQFLYAAALPLAGPAALAQSSLLPEAGLLTSRVIDVDPEPLLEALLTTPVTTLLLPAGTPPVDPVP